MAKPKRKMNEDAQPQATAAKQKKVQPKKSQPKAGKTYSEKGTVKQAPKHYPKLIDENDNKESDKIVFTEPLPKTNAKGQLVFPDHPEFRPNMTPKEVLHAGSFGGTYFRPIRSSVTDRNYSGVWKELPEDWISGLSIAKKVASPKYDEGVNTYGVKCGGSLDMWEESGWIHKQDPYGWFQWYCRFYQGRRTSDDERQIGRWLRCAGDTGRWRGNLISKCARATSSFDNKAISPVVRQTLQHWAYRLSKEDFEAGLKKMKQKGRV